MASFAPAIIDWSNLAGIGTDFSQAYERGRQRSLLTQIAGDGGEVDYDRLTRALIGSGNVADAARFAGVAQQERQNRRQVEASRRHQEQFRQIFGGDAAPGAAAPSAPMSPGRAPQQLGPVPPTSPGARMGTPGGTGAGDYLTTLRRQESGGDDAARNPSSSATGRYQFTDGTWRDVVNSPEGRAAGLRLDGRSDPAQQDVAARIFTAGNEQALRASGFDPTPGNLYMAHFLGRSGGPAFLRALNENPDAPATTAVSPDAASANASIFFNRDGTPRTVRQVYELQTRRFGNVAAVPAPAGSVQSEQLPPLAGPTQVAAAPATTATDATPAPMMPPAQPAMAPTAAPPAASPMPPQQMAQVGPGGPAAPAQPPLQDRLVRSIPVLYGMATDPDASPGDRQAAMALLNTALQDARGTDLQRNFEAWRRTRGGNGSLEEFMQLQRGPPSTQSVTGADGNTYSGFVDPGAPPSPGFPQGGFRVVGGADRSQPSYRVIDIPGRGPTMVQDDAPGGPRAVPIEGLTAPPEGQSPEARRETDVQRARNQEQRFVTLRDEATAARNQQTVLGEAERLMSSPGFYSGTAAQQVEQVQRLAASLGLDIGRPAAPIEAFRSLSNQAILTGLGGSLGNQISNADRDFIQSTAFNTDTTPAGNRLRIQFMRGIADRRVLGGNLALAYRQGPDGRSRSLDDGFERILNDFNQRNPISEVMRGGAYRLSDDRAATQIEFNALPRGALFMGPDGQVRRKP
jgi:hypothetical protein